MKSCKYRGSSRCNGYGKSCPYFNKHYWCWAYARNRWYPKILINNDNNVDTFKIIAVILFVILVLVLVFR